MSATDQYAMKLLEKDAEKRPKELDRDMVERIARGFVAATNALWIIADQNRCPEREKVGPVGITGETYPCYCAGCRAWRALKRIDGGMPP